MSRSTLYIVAPIMKKPKLLSLSSGSSSLKEFTTIAPESKAKSVDEIISGAVRLCQFPSLQLLLLP